MKKMMFSLSGLLLPVCWIPLLAMSRFPSSDKSTRHETRKERQWEWAHSADLATREQFHYDFPDANTASWSRHEYTEASFMDGIIPKTAYYDDDNNLVGTTTITSIDAIPLKARERIQKDWPGYAVSKVILFDDNEANSRDMFLYSLPVQDRDNYFIQLNKGKREIVVEAGTDGSVGYFTRLQ